jgi:hypothetical protein
MSNDSLERFLGLARPIAQSKESGSGARVVPVWRESLLDTDTPVTAYAKIRRGAFGFLLESAPAGGET